MNFSTFVEIVRRVQLLRSDLKLSSLRDRCKGSHRALRRARAPRPAADRAPRPARPTAGVPARVAGHPFRFLFLFSIISRFSRDILFFGDWILIGF